MKVLALDLSLTATGVAHTDGMAETLSPPKGRDSGMVRLSWLRESLWARMIAYGPGGWPVTAPDLVMIEDYAFSRGGHAHEIGELGGVVKNQLIELSQPYVLVAPTAVKKFATDKGNADKIKMAVAAAKLGQEFADDNCCDAWWLREMALYRFTDHLGSLRSATAPKTTYRDEVVSKIAWPELEARDVPA